MLITNTFFAEKDDAMSWREKRHTCVNKCSSCCFLFWAQEGRFFVHLGWWNFRNNKINSWKQDESSWEKLQSGFLIQPIKLKSKPVLTICCCTSLYSRSTLCKIELVCSRHWLSDALEWNESLTAETTALGLAGELRKKILLNRLKCKQKCGRTGSSAHPCDCAPNRWIRNQLRPKRDFRGRCCHDL